MRLLIVRTLRKYAPEGKSLVIQFISNTSPPPMTKSTSIGPEICDVDAAALLAVELSVNNEESFLDLISAGAIVEIR